MATIKNSFLNILITSKKYNYDLLTAIYIYIYAMYFILCKNVRSGVMYVLAQFVVFV